MAYCTAADIRREFPGTVIPASSDKNVDEADLAAWIDEASAEIDAKLYGRYVLPITTDAALLVLRSICIPIVAWRFAKAIDKKNDIPIPVAPGSFVQQPNVSQAITVARARLLSIMQGKETLIGESQTQGLQSFTADEPTEPTFENSKTQW